MKKKNSLLIICAITSSLILTNCATKKTDEAVRIEDTKTVLDVHKAEITKVEARYMIMGFQGQLTNEELANIKDFALEYQRLGRGNIIISYPQGAVVNGSTDALVRAAQKQLYIEGVDFKSMTFDAYQTANTNDPVVLSFARYQASEIKCKPWTQINPNSASSNQATERFGCAYSANLAAMIVDPGDLIGDRKEELSDAARAQKTLDDYRQGKLPQVSGSASNSGGSN